MDDATLELVIRTPQEVVAEIEAHSLRVPADTGQVGLRPRCEPAVLAMEPGLAIARTRAGAHFFATTGGLLRCDGRRVVVLTPVAVSGRDPQEVRARLEDALAVPRADLELRRVIERLEAGILRELRGGERSGRWETGT
jgi:F0F1-type ATP synthase epsilon subunit